jgi:CRISPR/Cas system CSM-associated protein Csm3 (group 7 of RAMP superfamily)
VVKGRDGLVYIPGSALKGKVRSACEALASLHRIGDCRAPHPGQMAPDRDTCLVCRIFGAPAQGTDLHWQSARLTEDWIAELRPNPESRAVLGQTIARTQVQLSRTRGLAAEARLFASELTAEGLTYEAKPALIGRLRLTPVSVVDDPDVYYELVLLLAGLKSVGTLGGGASRGAGECVLILPGNVIVDGRQVPVERQLANVEALALYTDEAAASHDR